MRYLDESIINFLTFLFLLFLFIWTVVIFAANLPKVIGSLLFEQLGKFPFNVVAYYILLGFGLILLFIIFRWIFRVLNKKAEKELESSQQKIA